jgi:lipopolysaccharide export LptBFGC system permease protein LptF
LGTSRTGAPTRITPPQLSIIQYIKGSLLIFTLLCCVLTIAQAQRVYRYLDGLTVHDQIKLLTWGLIGLQEVLLPGAAFIGTLFVCRRMWRRGHMFTLLAAGYSPWQLGKGLGWFAVLSCCLVGGVAHVAGPSALSELRSGFIDAFDSGKIYPVDLLNLGQRGAVSILPDTKESVGVLVDGSSLQLVYAEHSEFRRGGDGNWLHLKNVALAGSRVSMATQQLNLKVPTKAVMAFPKVLRGTKLTVSSKLDLSESISVFAYVRRWSLTILPLVLCMFAMALPGLLGDGLLAVVTAVLLAFIHIYFRWIELMSLSAEGNILAGGLFVFVCCVAAILCLRRAFWQLKSAS